MTHLCPGDGARAEILARLRAFEETPVQLFDEVVDQFGKERGAELWRTAESIYAEDHDLIVARISR